MLHQLRELFHLFSTVWRLNMMLVILSAILVNLFDFCFATRVHFIENSSKLISQKLISQRESEDFEALMRMKQASRDLYCMADLLNERFAFTLLVAITSKLAIFVVDVYWLYSRLSRGMVSFYLIRKKQ